MLYTPYFIEHPEEFEPFKYDPSNPDVEMIPKPNVTKEGLQSYYRFLVECEDEFVVDDKKELCKRMVDKFKNSKCYNFKTDEEKKEIINYLLNHPEINTSF